MAEQDEQRLITSPDTAGLGSSQTGRAVALARLLHHECNHLLQLYVSYQFPHSLCHTPLPVTGNDLAWN